MEELFETYGELISLLLFGCLILWIFHVILQVVGG